MLTIAVLAILITAPLGAVSISLLGPLLLSKTKDSNNSSENGQGIEIITILVIKSLIMSL